NVIHRDIKPQNIVLDAEGKEARIIDFGISSRVSMKTQHLGNPEQLEGTLAYISPEQTGRMNRVVDYRTDLYSLGATLYHFVTGQTPFLATDPMEIVHCHMAVEPKRPQDIRREIPG